MGNDVSVFQEGEIEKDFWKAHGPKNESWSEFCSRTFSGFTNILVQPDRMNYSLDEIEYQSEDINFDHTSISIPRQESSSGTKGEEEGMLAAALWQQRYQKEGHPSPPLIVYMHTNTRSLLDAKEVLPVCDAIGASLLAFDLPGCGRSSGKLSFEITQDLQLLIQHAVRELGYQEIILWARGMSTALAVEYCTCSGNCPDQNTNEDIEESPNDNSINAATHINNVVKFVVLDSPFTSVKQMVIDGSKAIKCFGLPIPETLVRLACKVVRGKVRARLGCDPFELKPLQQLHRAEERSLPPSFVLTASEDDYIPRSHGQEVFQGWSEKAAGKCHMKEFTGRHFGERARGLLLETVPALRASIQYDKEREDALALARIDFRRFPSPLGSFRSPI